MGERKEGEGGRKKGKRERERKREIQHVPSSSVRVSSFLFFCLDQKLLELPSVARRTRVTPQVFVSFSSHSPHHLTLRARSRGIAAAAGRLRGEYLRWVKSTVSSLVLSFFFFFLIFSYNGLEARREGGSCPVEWASASNDSVEQRKRVGYTRAPDDLKCRYPKSLMTSRCLMTTTGAPLICLRGEKAFGLPVIVLGKLNAML